MFKPQKLILTAGPSITQKEVDYVLDAVKNGWNEHWGDYLEKLEQITKDYLGVKHVIPTSCGTGALHLSLLACGIGKGDEVIISNFSFVAAASAVVYTGATPVFVDAQKDTWGIDPEKIESAITEKTKAILPVHMYGSPCEMGKINEIAKKHNLKVIEDACPAIGAKSQGKFLGTCGDLGTFSFQGAKVAVTGEGGMLVTNDDDLFEKAYWYNNHCRGKGEWFWFENVGYKYKMSNLLAALGCAQIERIEELLTMKKRVFGMYQERLKDIDGISMNIEKPGDRNTYWMSSVILDKDFGISRDSVMAKLREAMIDTRPFFHVLSDYPMYEEVNTPMARHIADNGINLPSGVLLSEEEIEYICNELKALL